LSCTSGSTFDAEKASRDALSSAEATSPDHWRRHYSGCVLGAVLAGQARYDEAEPLLVTGYEGMAQRISSTPFENRSALEDCGGWIVQLYERRGRAGSADEWRAKPPPKSQRTPW